MKHGILMVGLEIKRLAIKLLGPVRVRKGFCDHATQKKGVGRRIRRDSKPGQHFIRLRQPSLIRQSDRCGKRRGGLHGFLSFG